MTSRNIVQKIIDAHFQGGEKVPGQAVAIRIDQTLTQDATGTMAYLEFEALGVPCVETELSVSYVDHNTLQDGFENADDHRYLRTTAAKFGAVYSRAGNGICHQVQLERFARPGRTLLGADSHTPTGGGIGSMAIGAGGLDIAAAMAGEPFWIQYPKVTLVKLTGKLPPWSTAKDVILTVLQKISTMGNVGTMLEYGGPGVQTLSVTERATITNMGAETGVTTSIFPADEVTRKFMAAQGREENFMEFKPDPGAAYDRVLEIDLSAVVPMAACPHSPGNVKTVKELEGLAVQQVCIGSCTNSSYTDLVRVAEILNNRRIRPDMSLIITPGSRQALRMITDSGHLAQLMAAGARFGECVCGFCIGRGHSPETDAVSVRTNNRNFEGRSGTKSAQVYLVSPETAAACALSGTMTDPRSLGIEYPQVEEPERFLVDDSMLIFPPADSSNIEILRGPNIGKSPVGSPFPETLKLRLVLKVDDKITTDHIMPAGSRLKYRSNVDKYSEFVFEPLDPSFHVRCRENLDTGVFNLVAAGFSYGQGSSREHAAICPSHLGVRAVVAKSMERIHRANLINFGILPLLFVDETDHGKLNDNDNLVIENVSGLLTGGNGVLKNLENNEEYTVTCQLSEEERNILKAGGRLGFLREKLSGEASPSAEGLEAEN